MGINSPPRCARAGVLQLQRDDRRPPAETRDGGRLGSSPRRHVGESDVTDLPVADQVIQCAERLLDRRGRVEIVQPVDVDVVGLQTPQRVLQLLHDRLPAGSAAVWVVLVQVAEELRPDHDPVAQRGPAREVVADDLLGVAVGVDVGGVDRVAAPAQIGSQDVRGLLWAAAPTVILTEGHRAQREGADAQTRAAERDVGIERHGGTPWRNDVRGRRGGHPSAPPFDPAAWRSPRPMRADRCTIRSTLPGSCWPRAQFHGPLVWCITWTKFATGSRGLPQAVHARCGSRE